MMKVEAEERMKDCDLIQTGVIDILDRKIKKSDWKSFCIQSFSTDESYLVKFEYYPFFNKMKAISGNLEYYMSVEDAKNLVEFLSEFVYKKMDSH